MRLTIEEHPEAIKRYGHVKPGRAPGTTVCAAKCPDSTRRCTLAQGHRGPHVAHRRFGKVAAVWDSGASTRTPTSLQPVAQGRPLRDRRPDGPIGLKVDRPAGILQPLWDRLVTAISSVEELVFFIMFLAFVAFGIHWFLLIFF